MKNQGTYSCGHKTKSGLDSSLPCYQCAEKMADLNGIFGRITEDGNVDILYKDDGYPVTRLEADVWPVGSDLSARYEHPEGIVLSVEDAEKLGIEIEDL